MTNLTSQVFDEHQYPVQASTKTYRASGQTNKMIIIRGRQARQRWPGADERCCGQESNTRRDHSNPSITERGQRMMCASVLSNHSRPSYIPLRNILLRKENIPKFGETHNDCMNILHHVGEKQKEHCRTRSAMSNGAAFQTESSPPPTTATLTNT